MSATTAPRSARFYVLLLCGAEVLSMSGFATYAALLPLLRQEWALSNSQAGLISGTFFGAYMLAVPLLVGLTDRIDARRIYLLACLLATCGCLGFTFFARGLFSALASQALIGAGLAGTYMPGLRLLADNIKGTTQSRSIAFYTSSFGFGTSGSLLLAGALSAYDWRWAFALAAAGPLLAAGLVFFQVPPNPPPAPETRLSALYDFRPVIANREAFGYILGYTLHCWELFGLRSWLPTFFAFSLGLTAAGSGSLLGAATLAALINLLGPLASVFGNELALRFGRRRLVLAVMASSGALSCLIGFTAPLPIWLVFPLVAGYNLTVMADSAALTAGLVAAADPARRGSAMALHSLFGFGGGFVAPLVFGTVLDLAGGSNQVMAWGIAFASLGLGCLIGAILARTGHSG
jgi:MFS family permease